MTPFDRFWAVWPVKVGKKPAADLWKRKKLDRLVDVLVADVERRKAEDDRWLRGFIPNPATYLRQERWDDEIVKPRNGAQSASIPPVSDEKALLRFGVGHGLQPRPGESWFDFRRRIEAKVRAE